LFDSVVNKPITQEWATLEGRLYLEKMRDEERMGQGIKSEERANDSENA
jgi:hypothetical protein